MNEFDPTKKERQLGINPLDTFVSTVSGAENNLHMHLALKIYLIEELGIPVAKIETFYADIEAFLPDDELFTYDEEVAKDQMRLVLLRVVLPIAENTIAEDDKFREWTVKIAEKAMRCGEQGATHTPAKCVPFESKGDYHDCEYGINCPVKVTKELLIKDALIDTFESPDYYPDWSVQKTHRSLTKLDIARELGLVPKYDMGPIYSSYIKRCEEQSIRLPGSAEI